MPNISPSLTVANVLALVERGGPVDRAELISILVEGHYVEPPRTDDYREPVRLTPTARHLVDNAATRTYERYPIEGEQP